MPYLCTSEIETIEPKIKHVKEHGNRENETKLFLGNQCDTDPLNIIRVIGDNKEVNKNNNRKIHSCYYCPGKFRLVKNYHEHLETEHNIKTNKRKRYSLGACSVCGKIFSSRENLRLHLSVHNEENLYICAVENCAAPFKCKRYLIRHIKKYHSPIKSKKQKFIDLASKKQCSYICEACNITFQSPFEYGGHKLKCNLYIETKTEQNLPETGNSGIITASIASLKNQPRLKYDLTGILDETTNSMYYPCRQCDRVYQTKKSLYKHLKSHEGIVYRYQLKRKSCDICNKVVANLSCHMKEVHSDTKMFTCIFCQKRFKRKFSLNVHTRTHTGEKPYECYFCDGKFSQAGDRKKHMKIHHDFKNDLESSIVERNII